MQALETSYAEVPIGVGLARNRDNVALAYEILVSPTGTWTAIVTSPQGCTIPVASGTDWQSK